MKKRSEMLNTLKYVKFNYIWPESDWEDVGFTERPIWINSLGFGWVLCEKALVIMQEKV